MTCSFEIETKSWDFITGVHSSTLSYLQCLSSKVLHTWFLWIFRIKMMTA